MWGRVLQVRILLGLLNRFAIIHIKKSLQIISVLVTLFTEDMARWWRHTKPVRYLLG